MPISRSPGAPRSRRSDGSRNRERVLEAARAAVAGGSPLQLNEIARVAEVGVATVYRHFPSTDALVEAAVLPDFARLLEAARRGARRADPWVRLTVFLRVAIELQVRNAGFAQVVATERNVLPETIAVKSELAGVFQQLLADATAAGRVRKGIGLREIAALLCGVVYSIRLAEETQRARALRLYLDVLLTGIGA